jgi:hypothetical protein
MINLLCISIDHLAGVLYNEYSQTVKDLLANGRTCESLPGVNTSYSNVYIDFLDEIETSSFLPHPGQMHLLRIPYKTFLFYELFSQRCFHEIAVEQFSYVIHRVLA